MKSSIRIRIQPAELKDLTLPYPYFIDSWGFVERQDFWNGHPYKLIGFNPKPDAKVHKNTIDFKQFWRNPKSCLGMYPIFADDKDKWFTLKIKIQSFDIAI